MTVNISPASFIFHLRAFLYMAILPITSSHSNYWLQFERRVVGCHAPILAFTICSQFFNNLFTKNLQFIQIPRITNFYQFYRIFPFRHYAQKHRRNFVQIFFAFSIDKRSPPWYNKVYPERGTEREAHTMTTIQTKNISTYTNAGARAEQNLIYTICGQVRAHDSVPFDKGSDYPEWHMSIKSSRFTLASGHMMKSTTFSGQIEEYFERTASKVWAYVTEQGTAYIMNETEFRTFLYTFGKFEQDSTRNGGKYKVRFPRETKAMLAWLAMRA